MAKDDKIQIFGTQQHGSRIETIISSHESSNGQVPHQQFQFIPYDGTSSQQQNRSSSTLLNLFLQTFLPIGYPSSVKSEYLTYQIYDTIQALSSYLRSVLCTHALLIAAGVGTADANAMSAAITWIIKDGIGMFFSIFFTSTCSIYFGSYIKEWRLFADLINDLALTIDLLTPFFPRYLHLYILSVSAICKTMCGISANSTKLCITNHLCLHSNEADVNAKEGSQETAVCLIGLILGMIMSHFLTSSSSSSSSSSSYILFVFLTSLHIYCNYYAVKCLQLQSINRTRGYLLFKSAFDLFLSPSSSSNTYSQQSDLLSILSSRKSPLVDGGESEQKEEVERRQVKLFLKEYQSLNQSSTFSPLSISSINSQDSFILTLKLSSSSLSHSFSPIPNILVGISLQNALSHLNHDKINFLTFSQHSRNSKYCILPRQGNGYSVLLSEETTLLDQYEAYCRCLFMDYVQSKKSCENFQELFQETSEEFSLFWKGFLILLSAEVTNSFILFSLFRRNGISRNQSR